MLKNTQLKKEVKNKIRRNNILMLELAKINDNCFVPTISLMLSRNAPKLMHIDFLKSISKHLKININDLTEFVPEKKLQK